LKVVHLEEKLEKSFWNYVNADPVDYYFFIVDYKLFQDQAKILLAMEEEKIKGLMLIYLNYSVHLRGNREAVGMLVEKLDQSEITLLAPFECEKIVSRKYRTLAKGEVVIMCLRKGEEHVQIKHPPERLTSEDADEVAELLRNALPDWWDGTISEMQESLSNKFWLCIKRDGKIVSVGNTLLTDFGGNIGLVATYEQYRNMGYATSIVSSLVKEILKRSSTAVIHVESDNAPALHVYSKIGFKPYKSYFLFKGEKIGI
jgi:ribosomal protein S18 acetylase RimI-like enzyme